jgi:cation diffusion facilitator CzcD-associated flavoprotein CzcO
MYTLGYIFKPWVEAKAIADGPAILRYVRETAAENGIERHIRFNHMVKRASWSSDEARWTVQADVNGEAVQLTCSFLFMCSGYYDYDSGYRPEFPGIGAYRGQVIHPQHWPDQLDYANKQVVVIGSGATAVTLVPEMAKQAAHVVMLQRSPTYIVSRPAEDGFANWLRRHLPGKLAYSITRWRNVLLTMYFYQLARRKPAQVKRGILKLVRAQLGPDYDVATHFTPTYNPWDQRLCLVPDADLFASIKAGTSSIVTDTIQEFTPSGLRLASGRDLAADIVVTATGLQLKFIGGIEVFVDGARVDFAGRYTYKGMMFSDVPNFASAFGYTNASWTLKADLTSAYVCRLINHMDRRGYAYCEPVLKESEVQAEPFLSFTSGYVRRALHMMPLQGSKAPWKVHQNYALDMMALRFGRVEDGVMRFHARGRARAAA